MSQLNVFFDANIEEQTRQIRGMINQALRMLMLSKKCNKENWFSRLQLQLYAKQMFEYLWTHEGLWPPTANTQFGVHLKLKQTLHWLFQKEKLANFKQNYMCFA